MSSKNFQIIMKYALDTNQILWQNGQWKLSDTASKLVSQELGVAGQYQEVNPDVIDDHSSLFPAIVAEQLILQKYEQLGGHRSPLGLRLHPNVGVQSVGNTYFMDFRGGKIELSDPMNNKPAVAIKMREIEVHWVGLECRVRQEKVDEVYGGVAALIPGSGMSNSHKFPGDRAYWDMGPDGQRIVSVGVLLYKGPPMNLTLVASLVEHDSGDIEAYKHKFADVIAKAAKGLAVFAGVPAEAVAADQGFIDDLSLGLVNGISTVLGADDDPYVPQQLPLFAFDILRNNYPRQTLHRNDDPRIISYTHSLVVSGTDQGGDRGEYAFYFDIRQYEKQEILS